MLRRSFLKDSLALAGATLLPLRSWGFLVDKSTLYDCIILGAGPAGLTAARELASRDIHGSALKTLILEGADRIGGRLFTDHSKEKDFGSPLELGAEYIHLPPGQTALWKEVQRYGLQTKLYPRFTRGYLYNSQYLAPAPHSPLYSVEHFNFKVIKAAHLFKDVENYRGPDISGEAFMRRMNYQGFDAEAAKVLLTGHQGGSLSRLSIHGLQSDRIIEQIRSPYDYHVRGGYDGVLRGMMREIPPGNLLLGHRVNKIISGKNKTVQVYVPGVGWFTGKTVLCTASIGMLQSRSIDFTQFWTSEKDDALNFIQPSHQIKFSIRFKTRFWDDDMCMLSQLQAAERRTGISYFVPHYEEDDKPPVLTLVISGDPAKKLLSRPSQEILKLICDDLDVMYKLPDSIYQNVARRDDGSFIYSCKKWTEDPFARGGISYLQRAYEKNSMTSRTARQALASSAATRPVFWAGEATSLAEQPSSVHGAYSSGLRASNEIYDYLTV